MRKLLKLTEAVLICCLMFISCERNSNEVESPVTAAFSINVGNVTACSADVNFETKQQTIGEYLIVGPIISDECDYINMDAIRQVELIRNGGKTVSSPYKDRLEGLKANTEYCIGALGLSKDGDKIITAPVFTSFTTFCSDVLVEGGFELTDAGYRYFGTITPNQYTSKVKYVIGNKFIGMNEAELEEYLESDAEDIHEVEDITPLEVISKKKADVVIAALAFDESGHKGGFAMLYIATKDQIEVNVNGKLMALSKDLQNDMIYEGIVDMPARCEFSIDYNKIPFGFISYSGNGGIGTINNNYATIPYYNYPDGTDRFVCRRAVGRMVAEEKGETHKLWTNLKKDSKVLVRVEFIDYPDEPENALLKYYLELIEPEDPSVILYEDFDLFSYGGDYKDDVSGTAFVIDGSTVTNLGFDKYPDIDGTEPGIKGKCSRTKMGVSVFSYGQGIEKTPVANAEYIKNRGMEGWTMEMCAEVPSAMRINNSSSTHKYSGYLITPAFDKLTGPTDILIEVSMIRFASEGDIYLTILGDGEYNGAEVIENGVEPAKYYNAIGKDFIIDKSMCSKYSNDFKPKPSTVAFLKVKGATSSTKFKIDCSRTKDSKQGRLIVDEIRVTK